MLTRLSISNYVLIDTLDADFGEGMSVITGETGAGKSIVLGALGLILGNRADTQALLRHDRKCIVEAEFNIGKHGMDEFFAANGLDYDEHTLIRREINPAGKSRAFINDTPVSLALLKEMGLRLVDIHSQHESLTAGDSDFQYSVVDLHAGHQDKVAEFKKRYSDFRAMQARLAGLVAAETAARAEADYLQFQFDELEAASLKDGEQKPLEDELQRLGHAEEIKSGLVAACDLLAESEDSIISRARQLSATLSAFTGFDENIAQAVQRIQATTIELKDIAAELEHHHLSVQHDPQRVAQAGERLDELYRLQQKHRVASVEELLALRDSIGQRLSANLTMEQDIAGLKAGLLEAEKMLSTLSAKITAGRKKAATAIEKEIRALLAESGMPDGRLRIALEPLAGNPFNESGADRIAFLFSANKGVDFAPLSKVASGGELSRLMLCLKSMLARLSALPTLVFDEIDAGISGEVAFKIGNIVRRISGRHQVIAITHLPQMAAKGSAHYLVYKEGTKGTPATRIRLLNAGERVNEIAQMIGGHRPSGTALKNARELLLNQD